MLSVQPLKSAKGAADYYTAAFNYYAGDALAMRWLGKGASQLGLSGAIEKEQMLELLQGILPDGQLLQNKQGQHRPGVDMTFSAPKSVSVLVGLGADESLEILHDKAVEMALSQIEEEFAETRIVKEGQVHFEKTNNFVVAAFRQPSSRANEPALHTHCVTMNMTFDKKNKVRSLASDIHAHRGVVEQLQRNVTYAGLLYRTHLANLLKERGYTLAIAGDGLFEIEGMPESVMTGFSSRREEILDYMKEKGWSGAKAASIAAINTRDNKEEHDINKLKEEWTNRANSLGFDAHKFVKEALNTPIKMGLMEKIKETVFGLFYQEKNIEMMKAREAVEVAIEIISQKTSVFSLRELKEHALKHSLTGKEIIPSNFIVTAINERLNNQLLYKGIDPYSQEPVLTTPWLLTMEMESLARIENNKGSVSSITSKKDVIDFHKQFDSKAQFPLTPSQKQSMIDFLTTKDRYMAIQGYAGTGKTTMLRLTREIAENAGFKIRGLAVGSSAANELKIKGGIDADVFPVVHGELLRASKNDLVKTIFIVDEASMLSSPQGHELIKLIEQKGARLYLVGDDSQLPTVKNGRIFGLSQQYGIQTSEMTHNIRQKNSQLKEAVYHAIDKEVYDSVEKINELRELKSHDERISEVANSYLRLSEHVRNNTLVFAPTHANRREITAIIRDGLKKEGALGQQNTDFPTLKAKPFEEIQLHYAQYYTKGDVLRFNHPSRRHGIKHGDYLVVDEVSRDNKKNNTLKLINAEGKSFNFRLTELPNYKNTRAGFNRHIEVYQQESVELGEGDRIIWTRNFKTEGIFNSERALINSITNEFIVLTLDNGESKTMSREHEALKHFDHGYVFTNMKVQGKDKMYGIGLIESYNKFSATLKNFLVQISRGIHSMKLVTDDKTNLVRALEENDDNKKSSIDFVSKNQILDHKERFSKASNKLNINSIIEKKGFKESELENKHLQIEQYRIAKGSNNKAQTAVLAHRIISDPIMHKIAKNSLGFGYPVYREDALSVASIRLIKNLTDEEKQLFNIVKSYVKSNEGVRQAWNQALKINPSTANKEFAQNESIKRNALAFQITENIERYKPFLKHFSIGELNRLGLPQHRYAKFEEKAFSKLEQLAKHAANHKVYELVQQFHNSSINQPATAYEIKQHSRIAHPYLLQIAKEKGISVENIWKEINIQSKEYKDALFKETLSKNHQKAFEEIQKYRTLNANLAKTWKEHFKLLERNEKLPSLEEEQLKLNIEARNKIASSAFQDKAFLPALKYFKVDMDKLSRYSEKHSQLKNVQDYMSAQGDFKARMKAAELIITDIKGHYPYLKQLNVDIYKLNKYGRIITRVEKVSEMSEPEIKDYKKILSYKYESKKATSSWKKVFEMKKEKVNVPKWLLNEALESTAKRDYIASKIANNHQYAHLILNEKISSEKLTSQSLSHARRIVEVEKIHHERSDLLKRFESKSMMAEKVKHLHQAWKTLNHQTHKILSSEKLYHAAMRGISLSIENTSSSEKDIITKYELNLNISSPAKKSTYKSTSYQNIDITLTNERLMANPELTYTAIFGEPNKATSKELRYSGGLIVQLKGNKAGLWFDFGNDKGGGPIQAIMHSRGVEFKEALSIATELAGTKDWKEFEYKAPKKSIDEKQELKNKILSAKSIMKGAEPISNTLAEKYLKDHRKIEDPNRLNFKFWPKGATWLRQDENGKLVEQQNKIPALICPIKNAKGELTGVQRIYLDEQTGSKNKFMDNAKLSVGQLRASGCILQKGDKFGVLYIVEGPETGASIAMADPKATVLVSCGLGNMANLSKIIKNQFPSQVIIAGDNDKLANSNTEQLTLKAQHLLSLEGIHSDIVLPNKVDKLEKTDWNDVHKFQGLNEIRNQLGIHLYKNNTEVNSIAPNNKLDLSLINNSTSLKELENVYRNSENSKLIEAAALDRNLQKELPIHHPIGIKTPEFNQRIDTISKNDISLEI